MNKKINPTTNSYLIWAIVIMVIVLVVIIVEFDQNKLEFQQLQIENNLCISYNQVLDEKIGRLEYENEVNMSELNRCWTRLNRCIMEW